LSKKYFGAVLRWSWLVLLAPLLAGSIVFMVGARQPRLYDATARLVVGPGVKAVNPNLNDMRAASQLMWTYSEFATTPAVLQQVIDENGLSMSVGALCPKLR